MKNGFFFLLTIGLGFSACKIITWGSEPISKTKARNNPAFEIEYLFEHDGCKVYYFSDRGHDVYFTNCNGETASYPDSTAVIRNRTIRRN